LVFTGIEGDSGTSNAEGTSEQATSIFALKSDL